ncbi:hypothetical protein [Methylobacterium dankookense]|uniref:hypothetical protein n=1 Tax=Methylobacterium dankookense TaxID=560405 RepID=UPI0011A75985|nr:hypothetical protein [Methylobacterium dankookense]
MATYRVFCTYGHPDSSAGIASGTDSILADSDREAIDAARDFGNAHPNLFLVTASLLDSETGRVVWMHNANHPIDDVLTLL